MNPGELGITTPRLITAVTNTSSIGESEIPSERQTSPAAHGPDPPGDRAEEERERDRAAADRRGELVDRVADQPPDAAPVVPPCARPRAHVHDRPGDDERERREQDDAADRDPRHPGGTAHERQRERERDDEREDVAEPVAEDGAEGAAGRDLRRGREPARAEEVADPERAGRRSRRCRRARARRSGAR